LGKNKACVSHAAAARSSLRELVGCVRRLADENCRLTATAAFKSADFDPSLNGCS
jgi:hypothetical protein